LSAVGLPTKLPAIASAEVVAVMHHDKKIHHDALTWVYLDAIGKPKLAPVPVAELPAWVAPLWQLPTEVAGPTDN
jgi:3-dehydroquinate synthase